MQVDGHEDMIASTYLDERERMCSTFRGDCSQCPFTEGLDDREHTAYCTERTEYENPVKAVNIVLKWAKENPPFTNLAKFKEVFSNVEFEPISHGCKQGLFIPYSWFRRPFKEQTKTE